MRSQRSAAALAVPVFDFVRVEVPAIFSAEDHSAEISAQSRFVTTQKTNMSRVFGEVSGKPPFAERDFPVNYYRLRHRY